MTDEQALRQLRAVRAYCQPEHLAAVDHAMVALMVRAKEHEKTTPLP